MLAASDMDADEEEEEEEEEEIVPVKTVYVSHFLGRR